MKYLKKFSEHSDYLNQKPIVKPNVSYCQSDQHIHYNPRDFNSEFWKLEFKGQEIQYYKETENNKDVSLKIKSNGQLVFIDTEGNEYGTESVNGYVDENTSTYMDDLEWTYSSNCKSTYMNYLKITVLPDSLFANSTETLVTIPKQIKNYGMYLFKDSNITTLKIESNNCWIPFDQQYTPNGGFNGIQNIIIGKDVTSINYAMLDKEGLQSIQVESGNTKYKIVDGSLCLMDGTVLLTPAGITSSELQVGDYLMNDNSYVKYANLTSAQYANVVGIFVGRNPITHKKLFVRLSDLKSTTTYKFYKTKTIWNLGFQSYQTDNFTNGQSGKIFGYHPIESIENWAPQNGRDFGGRSNTEAWLSQINSLGLTLSDFPALNFVTSQTDNSYLPSNGEQSLMAYNYNRINNSYKKAANVTTNLNTWYWSSSFSGQDSAGYSRQAYLHFGSDYADSYGYNLLDYAYCVCLFLER